jgi:hypothetical protein
MIKQMIGGRYMSLLKQIDWQTISFIGATLVNEYWINIHFCKIYYWNGQRDYLKKIEIESSKDEKKIENVA